MPTYDYACGACGHTFEHFQSISDKLLRTCPECGKRRLERLFGTGIGVVFKGSGFYETDYKRKSDGGKSGEKTPRSGAGASGDAAQGKDKGKSGDSSGSTSGGGSDSGAGRDPGGKTKGDKPKSDRKARGNKSD